MRRALIFAALAVLAVACDDEAASPAGPDDAGRVADAGPPPDAAPLPDAGLPPPRLDADVPPPPPVEDVAWVEVALEPRLPLYTLSDHPRVVATAFDRYGRSIAAELELAPAPPGQAMVEDGELRFLAEGQGVVAACAGETCGQAAFFVDDAPPELVVDSPAQGAILSGFGGRTIAVRGRATDGRGGVLVRVNGQPADVAEDGSFSLDLPADFGLNRVVVEADDGVRLPAVTAVREVLWAPRFVPGTADGAEVPAALALRLDQALLDRDLEVEIPDVAGALELDEVAAFIGVVLGLVDGDRLLPNPQIASGNTFSLRVEGIRLGQPDVQAGFTADGIELFVALPDLSLTTQGGLRFEGQQLSLDGTLTASMATFARMIIALEDGALRVEVEEVGVAVESIGGRFADATAEALVSVLGNQFGAVARDLVTGLVEDVIRDTLPQVIETALGGILAGLREVPLNIDPRIEGVPAIRLVLAMRAAALELVRGVGLRLSLDASIRHVDPPPPPHDDPGIPTLSPDQEVLVAGDGMGVAVRLALINALLHEVWRGGTLTLRVPVPDQFSRLAGETFADALLPPVVVPAPPGSGEVLIAQIGAMRLTMQPEGLSEPHEFQVSLSAGLRVALVDGRVELGIAEEPEVHAVLIHKGDGREPTLGADSLALILRTVLWPEIRGALNGGLDFGLDSVAVDVGDFAQFAPRIQGLRITPAFQEIPSIRGGRLRLEGGLQVGLDLGE
ncbi:MAG: hypothetical protein H6706_21625 [Myxococcales bacterium]|nr:hypothetical protein [Myxococcales bacterium]